MRTQQQKANTLRKARGRSGTSKSLLRKMFDKQEVVKTQLWTSLEKRLRNRAVLWLFRVQPSTITSCFLSTLKPHALALASLKSAGWCTNLNECIRFSRFHVCCLANVPWTTFQGRDIYIRVQHLSGRDKGKRDGWIIMSSCAHRGRQTPAAQ